MPGTGDEAKAAFEAGVANREADQLDQAIGEFVKARGAPGGAFVGAVLTAMFRNTLLLGIALGFLVNVSGVAVPQALDDALGLIIRAALPSALFALGGVLVQYRPEGDLRVIAWVVAIALLLHPALMWLTGTAAGLPEDLFRSGVLTAAMAPGFNAYLFSNMYGRAKRIAASSVLIATGLSLLSVWMWLGLLG